MKLFISQDSNVEEVQRTKIFVAIDKRQSRRGAAHRDIK